MKNFSDALDIIKKKYKGNYSARGSWDMVSFEGENAEERCLQCYQEIKQLITVRAPIIPIEGNPYFQCRG